MLVLLLEFEDHERLEVAERGTSLVISADIRLGLSRSASDTSYIRANCEGVLNL